MITVSDSTPLIHFGTINRLDLLRSMYGHIFITEAVHREVVTEGIVLVRWTPFLWKKRLGTRIEVINPNGLMMWQSCKQILPRFTTRSPVQKKRNCSEDSSSEQKSGAEHSREEYRDDVDHLDERI